MRRALPLLLLLTACGAHSSPRTSVTQPQPQSCEAVGAVLDARADLLETPAAEGESGHLVRLENAKAALGSIEKYPQELRQDARDLLKAVERQLDLTVAATLELQKTYADVERTMALASTCEGIDARTPEAKPGSSRAEKALASLDSANPEVRATRKKNLATLSSKKCESLMHLHAAVRGVEVSSKVSVGDAGRHIRELHFEGETAKARDALAASLQAHAERLGAFQAIAKDEGREAIGIGISRFVSRVERWTSTCMSQPSVPSPFVESDTAARSATVLVRPTLPELSTGTEIETGSFGSGVLFTWRTPSGVESRVITNAHVVGDSVTAEVLDAEQVEQESRAIAGGEDRKRARSRAWKARVIRTSRDEDLVILKLESAPPQSARGVTLRFTAPKDEEPVVAAGFPALGDHPSFQVSKGSVSNRNYQSGEGPFAGYLQHTAAIDPGNSGGPLFDEHGALIGINTIKATTRDSVGFAIPWERIRLALLRADEPRRVSKSHAVALCDAFAATMASDTPSAALAEKLSTRTYSSNIHLDQRTTAYVRALPTDGPLWEARRNVIAQMRTRIEERGGVVPLTRCTDIVETAGEKASVAFEGRLGTASAAVRVRMVVEGGELLIHDVQ